MDPISHTIRATRAHEHHTSFNSHKCLPSFYSSTHFNTLHYKYNIAYVRSNVNTNEAYLGNNYGPFRVPTIRYKWRMQKTTKNMLGLIHFFLSNLNLHLPMYSTELFTNISLFSNNFQCLLQVLSIGIYRKSKYFTAHKALDKLLPIHGPMSHNRNLFRQICQNHTIHNKEPLLARSAGRIDVSPFILDFIQRI